MIDSKDGSNGNATQIFNSGLAPQEAEPVDISVPGDGRPSRTRGPALFYLSSNGVWTDLSDPHDPPEHPAGNLTRLDQALVLALVRYAEEQMTR